MLCRAMHLLHDFRREELEKAHALSQVNSKIAERKFYGNKKLAIRE
jgi:hypothetical protein